MFNAPIKSIALKNLLSFRDLPDFELKNLNVLIGPNGSGKSNLLEVVDLLRASANDIREVITRGGGVTEWIWKGAPAETAEVCLQLSGFSDGQLRQHTMSFAAENQAFHITREDIATAQIESSYLSFAKYLLRNGQLELLSPEETRLASRTLDPNQSVLSQIRDPATHPEITHIGDIYRHIRLYRGWVFGRQSVIRRPQLADMRHDQLAEDFSNLGLFLNYLISKPGIRQKLIAGLKNLYEEVTDLGVTIVGGTVQIYMTEGEFTIPATRLSDGTLRYLCLLAILCDPAPPPFIGIEEPELGLHPDILPELADLLIEASSRTQLLVTTHSDILVDCMTENPESVVVCEKHGGETTLKRLDQNDLSEWLEKYRLGELWTRGMLGGNRW